MKTATLLIVLLSHHGYWLGGTDATVTVNWAIDAKMPAAVFAWDLQFGTVSIANGSVNLPDAKTPATIKFSLPAIRAHTMLTLHYRLQPAAGGPDLETGDYAISAYPADIVEDYSERYKDKKVIVIENGQTLADLLKSAKVPFTAMKDSANLALQQPDVVFVGQDMLSDAVPADRTLKSLADGGCQILVLRQSAIKQILGYAISPRNISWNFAWRRDNPMLGGMGRYQLDSLIDGDRAGLAIQLPLDEPALEVAYWPPQVASKLPTAIDTLLVTTTIGKGRAVLCQLPLGQSEDDPRWLIFGNNILNYFSTRPEPTPAPRDRIVPIKVNPPATQPVDILSGERP